MMVHPDAVLPSLTKLNLPLSYLLLTSLNFLFSHFLLKNFFEFQFFFIRHLLIY